MKTPYTLTCLLFFFCAEVMYSQPPSSDKDYLWTYNGTNKTHTIGMYVSFSGGCTRLMDKPTSLLGGRIGIVLDKKWGIGLTGTALNYDRELTALVDEGSYRLQAGYAGMYFEYIHSFSNRIKTALSIATGQGIAFYQYNREFREDKLWYEEIIDQETFAVFEPGIEFQVKLSQKWWVSINTTFRTTSPTTFLGANDHFLETLNTGVRFKYGIF